MYLGIDLGTSGVKLLLLDDSQQTLATADAPLSVQQPQALWCEQHPADWWSAVTHAAAQLREQQPQAWSRVRAIGLSGQMHGAVLLDAQGQVLRPAVLWNDGRSAAQCAQLESAEPRLRQISGNRAMPGFTAPKLLWLREHEPDIFARTARVLLPKDWLRWQLTGEAVSEMSDASGTLWLDVSQRRWDESLLAACGLDVSHMPRLVEGSEISAPLSPAQAKAWGWSHPVLVAGGAGDNAASAIGVGALASGQGFVSLGTSGVIFRVTERFEPAPEQAVHAFAHALPQRWHQMSVMLSAASALGWLARLSGTPEARLSDLAASLPLSRRMQAPLFLPYLQGERTPHNNPLLTANLSGLQAGHELADLAYAVMEGVSLGLLDGWQAMGQTGPSAQSLALVGGGARSDVWAQSLSSALQCPLHRSPHAPVAAALGAARLAMMAEQGCNDLPCASEGTAQTFEPDAAETATLLARHARFKALFGQLHGAGDAL
jgi:xylulokinase